MSEPAISTLQQALIGIGDPVVGARVSQAKSGLSSYLLVSVTVDEQTSDVSAGLLRQILTTLDAHWPEGERRFSLSAHQAGAGAIDTGGAARELLLSEGSIDITGSISMSRIGLSDWAQPW
ncbi:hypothetical protein ACXR2T_08000 [Leucobacter sp. HY1910]